MSDQPRDYIVRENTAEKTETNKDHAEQKRDGALIITNDNRNIHPKATHDDREKPNWVEKGTLAVLTLTLFAAGYAGYEAHRLADSTEVAIGDARKVADAQSRDTTQSLQIARDAANATRASIEAVKIQLRPYISFDQVDISDATGPLAPTIFLQIKNAGVTPAYDLEWLTSYAAVPFPNSPDIVVDRTKPISHGALAVGASLSKTYTIEGWNAEWGQKITAGSAAIFVVGEISFIDAFKCKTLIKFKLIHGGYAGVRPSKLTVAQDGNDQQPPTCPEPRK